MYIRDYKRTYCCHSAYTQEWNPILLRPVNPFGSKSGGNFAAGTNEGYVQCPVLIFCNLFMLSAMYSLLALLTG